MTDPIDSSESRRRSWGQRVIDFLGEFLDCPDDLESFLIVAGIVVGDGLDWRDQCRV